MRGLTCQDTAKVLRRLGALDFVLIGGQAVNFWAEQYRSRVPGLIDGPFTSKDIDFQAGRDVARLCADRIEGAQLVVSDLDNASAQCAKVIFELEGEPRAIDFLSVTHGVDDKKVQERSIAVTASDDPNGPRDIAFRVMHPVDCLKSRTKNVMGLPGYGTPEALQQLRASVWCAKEFIGDLASGGVSGDTQQRRAALKLSEEIFSFCRDDMQAKELFHQRAIDPFEAVHPHVGMPDLFRDERYPRMLRRLEYLRRVPMTP